MLKCHFRSAKVPLLYIQCTFQGLDGNILMLVHPSSGDNKFYEMSDASSIIQINSFGNVPK